MIALEHGTLAHASEITVAVVFTIVLSVYLHGLSARPLTDRYARWYRAHADDRLPAHGERARAGPALAAHRGRARLPGRDAAA